MRANSVLRGAYKNIIVDNPIKSVQLVTLDRPKALNALNNELMAEFNDILDKAQSDSDITSIVLTGSDKAFAGTRHSY